VIVKDKPRSKGWIAAAAVLITALVPFVLLLTSLRLLLTDAFIHVEYRLPAFPQDPYGFTLVDRLYWAPIALEYLLNDESIDFLGDLEFDDGSPVYNQRELQHMVDVKDLTQLALGVWLACLACVVLLGFILYRTGNRDVFWSSLRRGAKIMLWIMIALSITLVISFSFVFVGFHRIFFEAGTWQFNYSDTLIRLFPLRFWRDVFIFLIAFIVGLSGIVWVVSSRLLRGMQPAD
jgi:integral membrane protein (TIGR01906 family)